MTASPAERPGLQAERTALSWERSAIGLLAAGALLLLRHREPMTIGRAATAAAALLLALAMTWFARRRARALRKPRRMGTRPVVPDGWCEIRIVGWSVAGLAAATALLLTTL